MLGLKPIRVFCSSQSPIALIRSAQTSCKLYQYVILSHACCFTLVWHARSGAIGVKWLDVTVNTGMRAHLARALCSGRGEERMRLRMFFQCGSASGAEMFGPGAQRVAATSLLKCST